jgi:hypothetical protein
MQWHDIGQGKVEESTAAAARRPRCLVLRSPRSMNRWHTILWLVGLMACGGDRPEGAAASARTSAASASLPVASGSAPHGPSARPSAAAAAAPGPLTGTWSGKYRSEKAKPTLDPTVRVKAWSKDDGAHGSGEGDLRLEVAPDGSVKGSVEGPLGPADLVGTVEGERVFALLQPRSDEIGAFAGSLEATLEGAALVVRLRAADGAAVAVRSGEARLSR